MDSMNPGIAGIPRIPGIPGVLGIQDSRGPWIPGALARTRDSKGSRHSRGSWDFRDCKGSRKMSAQVLPTNLESKWTFIVILFPNKMQAARCHPSALDQHAQREKLFVLLPKFPLASVQPKLCYSSSSCGFLATGSKPDCTLLIICVCRPAKPTTRNRIAKTACRMASSPKPTARITIVTAENN